MKQNTFSNYVDKIFWVVAPTFLMGAVPEHIISYYLTRNLNDAIRTCIVWGILSLFVVISCIKYVELVRKCGRNVLKTIIIPVLALLLLIVSVIRTDFDKSVVKNLITQTIYLVPVYVMAVSAIFEEKLKIFVGNFKWTALVLMPGMFIYIYDVVTATSLGGNFKGLNSIIYLSMAYAVAIIIIGCLLDLFYVEKEDIKNRVIDYICIFIYSGGIIFTGGRAPFLMLALGVCTYIAAWIYWNRRSFIAGIYKMIPVVLIGAGCIIGHMFIMQYNARSMSPLYRIQVGLVGSMKYVTNKETIEETVAATQSSTVKETTAATQSPTVKETTAATQSPTVKETTAATQAPTVKKTTAATQSPTVKETTAATQSPTVKETKAATQAPTVKETKAATQAPTSPSEVAFIEGNKYISVSDITRNKIMMLCDKDDIGFFDAANILYNDSKENESVRNECYQILQKSYGRIYLNKIAIEEAKSHLFSGMGVYGYQKKYKTYTHNIFTECMADGGIIIGTLFLIIFVTAMMYVYIMAFNNMQYVVPASLITMLFVRIFFSGNLYISCEMVLLFTYACAIKLIKGEK
ncbi:MAG: hypothetical protein ACI4EJ_02570 [Bacteroides sp.]